MNNLYNEIFQEHHDVDSKQLKKFLENFKKPTVQYDTSFKISLNKKLSKKIQEKKEVNDNQILSTVPAFAKWRYRMTGFVTAMCVFLFVFILSFFSDFFGNQIFIPHKYTEIESFWLEGNHEKSKNDWVSNSQAPKNRMMEELVFTEALWSDAEEWEKGYLYDGKKYPKVGAEMPVYRNAGVLVNEVWLRNVLWGLKFGDFSLKAFPDASLSSLQFVGSGGLYTISINPSIGEVSLYEKDSFGGDDTLVEKKLSEKELNKRIEKKLKTWGISLKGYDSPRYSWLDESVYVNWNIVEVFYPFLLNGFPVWDINFRQVGVRGTYNIQFDALTLYGIDIAKYEYVPYPTFSKDEVLSDFTVGMKKLNAPEIVYLEKYYDDEVFYIPWLRFVIDENESLFKELVNVT